MSTAVKVRDWLTNWRLTRGSLLRVLLLSSPRARVRFRAEGKDLIILGNGPSLGEALSRHGKLLEGRDLMCVNKVPLYKQFEQFRARHYLLNAPEAWHPDVAPEIADEWTKVFSELARKTTWPLICHFPVLARKHPQRMAPLLSNPQIEIRYYNSTGIEGFPGFCRWAFAKQWGMPRPHNVLIPALVLGLRMGYRNLVLLGAEHSWLPTLRVDENNRATVGDHHFYAETEVRGTMHQGGKGSRKLHEILHKFMLTFAGYFPIADWARRRGQHVWNATPDSFIDAFDRVNLDELAKRGYRFAERA